MMHLVENTYIQYCLFFRYLELNLIPSFNTYSNTEFLPADQEYYTYVIIDYLKKYLHYITIMSASICIILLFLYSYDFGERYYLLPLSDQPPSFFDTMLF